MQRFDVETVMLSSTGLVDGYGRTEDSKPFNWFATLYAAQDRFADFLQSVGAVQKNQAGLVQRNLPCRYGIFSSTERHAGTIRFEF